MWRKFGKQIEFCFILSNYIMLTLSYLYLDDAVPLCTTTQPPLWCCSLSAVNIWAAFSSFPVLFNKTNESQKALNYVLRSKLFFQAIDDIFGNSQFLKIVWHFVSFASYFLFWMEWHLFSSLYRVPQKKQQFFSASDPFWYFGHLMRLKLQNFKGRPP